LSIPGVTAILDPESAQKLKDAEVVLGVIKVGLSEACCQELDGAMALRKNMIVMSDPIYAPLLQPAFESNLVAIHPANQDQAEGGIVQHLKALDAGQNANKALLALGTIALGLLIFAPSDRS
jgi:hypothetical protein